MAGKEKGKLHIHINLGTLVFLVIVVYLMAYMLTYIGKDKLAIYEVSASDIVDNIEGTGVILRQENLVNAAQDGYINYYVQDGAMVNKNGVVYMIDTTGEIQDYLKKVLEKKNTMSLDEKEQIIEKLKIFSEGYTDNHFSLSYETQNDINNTLLDYTDAMLTEHKAELEEKYGKDSYVEVTSAQEGLVSFVSDGQENLKQSQVSEETFLSKAKMSDLRTNKKQKAGSPVYRFIKGQDWQLMVPVGQNGYNRFKKRAEDNSSIQVTFQKDNFTTTTSYRCLKQNGKYYVILSFDNYIQRYLNQRYLSVSLTLSETNGLKIPSSSLVKKSVYRIPKSFLVHGGNSAEKDQLNIMETNKKGEKVLRQTSAIVYKTNDKYAYVVSKDLKTGIIISETDKQKIYTIKDSDKVEILGVYMVNKGYAVFALVDMVERNGDYCIVSTSGSKIELYDKVKYIIDKVELIHSVDSLHLAKQIEKEAVKKGVDAQILVQVNIAQEDTKFGIDGPEVMSLVEEISKFPHVHIRGLMTSAPFVANPEENRCYFKKLHKLFVDIREKNIDNVSMDILSMGMTNDYEVAIEEGATMVRVGTGIFGARNYNK